jgi:hypothetical protein
MKTCLSNLPSDNKLQNDIDNLTTGPCLYYKLSSIICRPYYPKAETDFYIFARKQVSLFDYKWFKYHNGTMTQVETEYVK